MNCSLHACRDQWSYICVFAGMDPLSLMRWLGVCVEPTIEEAQPAWWLELERAEELQKEADRNDCFQNRSSPKFPSLKSKCEKRAVRFAAEPDASSGPCCYENDSEFVVARQGRKPEGNHAVQTLVNDLGPWDLGDLDDIESMRQALLQPIEGSYSYQPGGCSQSDCHGAHYPCSGPPSDAEEEFCVFQRNLANVEQ